MFEQEKDSLFYGEIKYNEIGYPICAICHKAYKKLLAHVWQKHDISATEYKAMFGLDKNKGILCEESLNKCRENVKNNYETVVKANLLKQGAKTRFKNGDKGRTANAVSEQSKKMLGERAKRMGAMRITKEG